MPDFSGKCAGCKKRKSYLYIDNTGRKGPKGRRVCWQCMDAERQDDPAYLRAKNRDTRKPFKPQDRERLKGKIGKKKSIGKSSKTKIKKTLKKKGKS